MGKNPPYLRTGPLALFLIFFIALSAQCQIRRMPQSYQSPAEKTALAYVAKFNDGAAFSPPSEGLMSNGAPALDAIEVLRKALLSSGPDTREKIVDLLADLGLQSRMIARGIEVIKDPAIIGAMAGPGLAKADLGRARAAICLRRYGMEPELRAHGAAFAKALAEQPSEELLLLVAKAKAVEAMELLQRLKFDDEWHSSQSLLIALAALGDRSTEDKFVAAFESAATPEAFAEAVYPLSMIGTERSLKVLAASLRSALIIDRPRIEQKSVRIDVLEGLRYNFPDQPVLYPNNIVTDADYAAAEAFCEKEFGTKYVHPRPPFLTYFGYPR